MQVFSSKDSNLVRVSAKMEVTVNREPFDWTPQQMEGFEPVAFEKVQKELPPMEPWEPGRWELLRPDEHPQIKPAEAIAGSLTVQNILTGFLIRQATTSFLLPCGTPDSAFEPLFAVFRSLTRRGSDGTAQQLSYGTPGSFTLFRFFDCLREGKVHPLFTESVKTYAAFGPAELDVVRYQQFPEAETPGLSDPLVKEIAGLPEGTKFHINVYLPAEAARESSILRQIAGLSETHVLCGMRKDGKDFITGLIGKREASDKK